MKTKLITLCTFAVASAALFSCSKEQDVIVEESSTSTGIPFEIIAGTPETRTVNDGMSTTWESTDKISLFHAEAGDDTYVNDGQFDASAAGSNVTFSGTLGAELTADKYDWYAIYPFNVANTTPANGGSTGYLTIGSASNGTQTQTGNNSKAHLAGSNYPVAGIATNVDKDTKPAIVMNQLTSVVAVEVTNSTTSAITVNDVAFQGTEPIVGTFYVNFAASPVVFTQSNISYVSNTAKLHVNSGASIPAGEKATFYLAIKPFTAASGNTLTMSVNGSNGNQTKTSSALNSDFSFVAGKIHKLTFSYSKSIVSTASEAYTTGFESGDSFSATTSYNNTAVKYQGPSDKPWGILSGSASATSPVSGSQSMMLRDYTANAFMPYAYTDFKLSAVKEVRIKAKAAVAGYNLVLSTSPDFITWTDANTFTLTTSSAEYSYTFPETLNNVAVKFTVSAASRGNKDDVWFDDVNISSTAIVPTILVTTSAATNLTTAAGTTATVNGSLSLLYGAIIGDLDEAGFYYKASGAGSFTKVTCSPTPTTNSFSYNLTGLTAGTTYTFKAYGVYDGGSEVLGSELTFTPLAATTYSMIIAANTNGSANVEWSTANTILSYGTVGETAVNWTTTVTWNSESYMGGDKNKVQIGKADKSGSRYSPSSITITTTAFAGKKILSASLTGNYTGSAATNLTITAGTTDMLSDEALVSGSATTYTTTSDPVTLSAGQAVTFSLSTGDVSGSVVITGLTVVYSD